jgi:DinB superfamily
MQRFVACVTLSVLLVAPLAGEPMKAGDRQRLLAHLEMTESWLMSELNGLSPAQLTYRMTPESWSITDVTEHLAIAEPQYWQRVQDSMKQPATTEKLEATDAAILWYGIDRTNRQKTGEARVPHGTFKTAADALATFRKLRSTMRDYAQSTSDDLRSRKLLEGNMDVYQWFLMISTHSQRHILQIREVKAHSGYPKE